jgi:hypothetical protein
LRLTDTAVRPGIEVDGSIERSSPSLAIGRAPANYGELCQPLARAREAVGPLNVDRGLGAAQKTHPGQRRRGLLVQWQVHLLGFAGTYPALAGDDLKEP